MLKERFFRRLTYLQKFFTISLAFFIPLLLVTYYMIQAQNTILYKEELELKGNEYQHLLRILWEKVPQHKLMAFNLLSGSGQQEDVMLLGLKISHDLKKLDEFDSEVEIPLKTDSEKLETRRLSYLKPSELFPKWTSLQREQFELNKDVSNARHDEISRDLQELLQYISETSHLLYDPDIDVIVESTFYLLVEGQVILNESLEQIYLRGKQEKGKLPSTSLESLLSVLSMNLNKFQKKIQRAALEDVFLKDKGAASANLKLLQERYSEAANNYIRLVTDQLIKGSAPFDLQEILNAASKVFSTSFAFWDNTTELLQKILEDRIDTLRLQQKRIIVLSAVLILLGFSYGIWAIRGLSIPLRDLVIAAEDLASGKIQTRVKVTNFDEVGLVGEAFNRLADSFQRLFQNLQSNVMQLVTSTLEIAASAKEQESIILEQESSTQEISSSASEIYQLARRFVDAMARVCNITEKTTELASSGRTGIAQMENIMKQIVEASTNISYKLGVLNEKTTTIISIIGTIAKVAEQTNLLSLNASIEAEKAGEHGRSFSVIAAEIRRLAEQTSSATFDIEKMINEIITAVSAGVMGVDKFSEEIRKGVGQLGQINGQLSTIMEQVQKQTTGFDAINEAMRFQTMNAEQINEGIHNMIKTSQETHESMRHFYSTIDHLNLASKKLQGLVMQMQGPKSS